MKKTVLFLALATHVFTCQAAEQVCGDLNDYIVQKVSFTDVTLQAGLIQLTTGMPYQTIVNNGADIKVSASDVSGNLGAVLDKFSKDAGFTYKQNKCLVEVTVNAPKLKWQINSGDKISDRFNSWAKANGWSLSWETQEVVAEAGVVFTGTFDEAVVMVVDALNSSGNSLHARFYEANKVLRITERK